MQVNVLFTSFSHPDKLAQVSSCFSYTDPSCLPVSRLVEFSQSPLLDLQSLQLSCFLRRYINSCSLCCSTEADAAWRKQSWQARGVNNTHLEVCHAVARCDTLKAHSTSSRWCPLTFPPSALWGRKHVKEKWKSRTWLGFSLFVEQKGQEVRGQKYPSGV